MALFSFISIVAGRDYMAFSDQKSPELIDVETIESDLSFTRKWVTLTNFHPNCERVDYTRRTDPVEKLVDGPYYATFVPITNSSGRELIVAIFDGDISCPDLLNQPLSGILTSTRDYSYGVGFLSTRLSKTTVATLVLHVDQGLGHSKISLAIGIIFNIVFLSFFVYSIRLWLEKWESRIE
jgi:hypothetical protein